MSLRGPFTSPRDRRATAAWLLLAAFSLTSLPSAEAAAAAPAQAPVPQTEGTAPRTSLVDLEDEVMCPICGTLLELSNSPQAERQRAYIARLIAAGRTEAEIKDALVTEYGRRVLALPRGSGFDLSAYLVPAVAFAVAALALGFGVRRWRRAGAGSATQAPRGPDGEDAERLDADLARYEL